MKYIVLIPYFGKTPEWWPFYIRGVRANKSIDFIIISDCIKPVAEVDNLRVINASLSDIRKKASQVLDRDVALTHFKKLCDLKPMYGLIFSDLIKGYDFWGFGDIDLVYGNLSHFIDPQASKADILSFRSLWLSGSLAFFRNTPVINSLYRQSRIWTQVVESPVHIGFGEMCGIRYLERIAGREFVEIKGCEESFSAIVDRKGKMGDVRLWFQDAAMEKLGLSAVLEWTPEGIFDYKTRKQWAYYHLVVDKRRFFKARASFVPRDRFFITGTGFHDESDFFSWSFKLRSAAASAKGLIGMTKRALPRFLKLKHFFRGKGTQ